MSENLERLNERARQARRARDASDAVTEMRTEGIRTGTVENLVDGARVFDTQTGLEGYVAGRAVDGRDGPLVIVKLGPNERITTRRPRELVLRPRPPE
jgi:hypothetical protein